MTRILLILPIWWCALGAGGAEPHAARTNFVLCMADDQGWEEVGYYGHPHLKTPVLDEMARNGFRFDRFYAASSNCGPSRGSIMTGRHAFRFGQFGPTWSMRPEEITLAEILKDHGYATGHFGKWHLGPVKAGAPNNPGASGFDEWLSHDNFFGLDPVLSRNGAPPAVFRGESSEIIVREACEFIGGAVAQDKPFLVVIWFGSCHGPYEATPADRAVYAHLESDRLPDRYGEITAIDRSMGLLREALDEFEARENTLLWYCSDNGVPHHSRYQARLNGAKGNLLEGGVRVPGIIEWPREIRTPGRSEAACVTSDMLPTICQIADAPLPDRVLDGTSLLPVIRGEVDRRPAPIFFWHYNTEPEYENRPWMDAESQRGTTPTPSDPATQFRNFHHPVAKTSDFGGDAAVLDGRYKLILDLTGRHRNPVRTAPSVDSDVSLFDLHEDPGETTNVADRFPEVVTRLTGRLRDWQASVEQSMTGAEYDLR